MFKRIESLAPHLDPRTVAASFGRVVTVAEPLPEEYARESSAPVIREAPAGVPSEPASFTATIGILARLKSDDAARKRRVAELIATLAPLLQKADRLVEECKAERITFLDAEHDRVVAQGRELLAKIENVLAPASAQALRDWNQARETKQQRFADLEQAKEIVKHQSQWATKKEIAAAENAFEAAQKKTRAAIEAEAAALAEYNRAESALETARSTLAEWAKRERQLDLEMSGQPYVDPFTGLTATPAV